MRLLNIGAGSKGIPVLPWYEGWDVVRLDIEPKAEPDLLMDALDIDTLKPGQFDAIYASHVLEHIYLFHLMRFLNGVRNVLKSDGFAEFRVPNALQACKVAVRKGRLSAPCYKIPGGMITAWDMLYGYTKYQMQWGEPMAHHNAFDPQRLAATLNYVFDKVYVQDATWELRGVACKTDLSDTMKTRMNIDKDRAVHPDTGAANVGAIRQFRAVANVPLRPPSRD